MPGCLVYSSIASTRSGVELGARGATRVKLGSPNSGIRLRKGRPNILTESDRSHTAARIIRTGKNLVLAAYK